MLFPVCIRLDVSDLRVFPLAAEPGEPAVPGTFAFFECDPEALERKEQFAFQFGWLGTDSFGYSSLVEIGEIDDAAFAQVVERLAQHFVDHFGAPDLATALPAAREEADYAAALCEDKLHTLLALERSLDENGQIHEQYRVIRPSRAEEHAKIWNLVEETD
jgi:hypothetical protein